MKLVGTVMEIMCSDFLTLKYCYRSFGVNTHVGRPYSLYKTEHYM